MKKQFTLSISLLLILILSTNFIQAQRPDAPIYAQRGAYAVGTQELLLEDDESRPLTAAIWYPALNPDGLEEVTTYVLNALVQFEGHALQDADPNVVDGPYPLMIFSHGNGGFRYQSTFFAEHLASHGFVVISVDHAGNTILDRLLDEDAFNVNLIDNYAHRPLDIHRAIAHAEELSAEGGVMAGVIDMDTIAISGHSFGGYTALTASGIPQNFATLGTWCYDNMDNPLAGGVCFLSEYEEQIATLAGYDTPPDGTWTPLVDERIQATIAFAPWNGPILDEASLNAHTTPTMILAGVADSTTPIARDASLIYERLTSADKALITFDNAEHYIFVDTCNDIAISFGLFGSCSDPVWDMGRIHDLINHFTTAFLLSEFYDDVSAREALNPENIDLLGVNYDQVGLID